MIRRRGSSPHSKRRRGLEILSMYLIRRARRFSCTARRVFHAGRQAHDLEFQAPRLMHVEAELSDSAASSNGQLHESCLDTDPTQ